MALQTPVALQGIASATAQQWPAMSAMLRSPLQGLARHQAAAGAPQRRVSGAASQARSASTLPDFFRPANMSALRPSLGALRSFSPTAQDLPFHSLAARQYSTIPRMGPLSSLRALPRVGNVGLALTQQRTLFGAAPSQNQLARLELAANNTPNNAAAQAAFYNALLRASMPQIIVDRHRTGRFASNSTVDAAYEKALGMVGQSDATHSGQNMQHSNGNMSPEQMQAVGQAVGTHVGGGQLGKTRGGAGVKADPLYVVVEESIWSTGFKWVRWILSFALAAYVALICITIFVDMSGVMKKVGGGAPTEVRPEQQTTRFSDVHGCEEVKEELQDVVDFLKNPEKYNKLGGRLPKGVLLIGPPGTGKTLIARAIAGEAGVPFFYMSGSEFEEMYVGVGAKRVRELFAAARAKSPAIVFIDEIDAVGGKRQSKEANYHRQTLNQLLQDLDGFDQTAPVIFIAATNHPEILDKALLRPGRFDRHITFDLPDVKGRVAILQHHTKKIRLSPDADLTKIARGTPGFSGAELENLANTAAIQASKKQSKAVNNDDLEWAKDKIMMGSERKNRFVPLQDKLQTAYHEGGHALVGLYTKGYKEVHKATILPRGVAAGITFFLPQEDQHHRSKSQYNVDLAVSMGGRMAEEIVYGPESVGDGASGDISQATSLAYNMVTAYGFSDLLGNVDFRSNYEHVSPETKRIIDNEVRRLIDEAKISARDLLLSKRAELDLLAKALVQYETLDKEEILKVIRGETLKDRLIASPEAQIKIPTWTVGTHVPVVPPPVRPRSGDSDPPGGSGVPA